MRKLNTIELLVYIRELGFTTTPRDTYELDIILNKLVDNKLDVKKIVKQAIDIVVKRTKTPTLANLNSVFKLARNLKPYLVGVENEAKEKNEKFEEVLNGIDGYNR